MMTEKSISTFCAESLLSYTRKSMNRTKQLLVYFLATQGHVPAIFICVLGIFFIQIDLSSETSPSSWDQNKENAPMFDRQTESKCNFPCKCSGKPINCKAGVTIKRDGCNCCYMCTRQQGDLCDIKEICDEEKNLYCDMVLHGGTKGICRARNAEPCRVNGSMYKDAEEFNMNCSHLCTCQNGQYACSTLCPQEERPPSTVHCKNPILVKIESRCCREWVCPHSHSVVDPTEFASEVPPIGGCKREISEWGACSTTCDMGYSIRMNSDNDRCETVQEHRLCYVRPCDQQDRHLGNKHCKSTWKSTDQTHLMYEGCTSIELYKPKYCSTCKKRKCCGPEKTKTRQIKFRCPDGKVFIRAFMWVKSCKCFKHRKCPFT